jgi:hypothetical protein
MARRWRTVLLTVPVVGALAFGGTQALAAPAAEAPAADRCRPDVRCDAVCPVTGGLSGQLHRRMQVLHLIEFRSR